jgi:hypothetical protein
LTKEGGVDDEEEVLHHRLIFVALVVVNLINLELPHLLHRINVNNERMIVEIPVVLYWILVEL